MAKEKVIKDTAERWLLTYADLMNLLLIFFIILYAMSQTDQAKFDNLAQSMRVAFGETGASYNPYSGTNNSLINLEANAPSSPVIPSEMEADAMKDVEEKINQIKELKNLGDDIKVTVNERGIKISINSTMVFKSGSEEIEPIVKPTITEIGDALKNDKLKENYIRIEGHTDSDPISNGKYASNWELSSARATKIVKFLIDYSAINPQKISAVGYGEYQPIEKNDTEVGKSKNRRVDIIIPSTSIKADSP